MYKWGVFLLVTFLRPLLVTGNKDFDYCVVEGAVYS